MQTVQSVMQPSLVPPPVLAGNALGVLSAPHVSPPHVEVLGMRHWTALKQVYSNVERHMAKVLPDSAADKDAGTMDRSYFIAPKSDDVLRGYIASGRMLGVFKSNVLAGFGHLALTSEAPAGTKVYDGLTEMEPPVGRDLFDPRSTGVMHTIMVDPNPNFRNHGLGRLIIEGLLDLSRNSRYGLTTVAAIVCTNNPRSYHKFINAGMEVVHAGKDKSDSSNVLFFRGDIASMRPVEHRTVHNVRTPCRLQVLRPHEDYKQMMGMMSAGWRGVALDPAHKDRIVFQLS